MQRLNTRSKHSAIDSGMVDDFNTLSLTKPQARAHVLAEIGGGGDDDGPNPLTGCHILPHLGDACVVHGRGRGHGHGPCLRSLKSHRPDGGDDDDVFSCHPRHGHDPDPYHRHHRRGDVALFHN